MGKRKKVIIEGTISLLDEIYFKEMDGKIDEITTDYGEVFPIKKLKINFKNQNKSKKKSIREYMLGKW